MIRKYQLFSGCRSIVFPNGVRHTFDSESISLDDSDAKNKDIIAELESMVSVGNAIKIPAPVIPPKQ